MKTFGKKAAWVGVWLAVSACHTPGVRGSRPLSAVEPSGAFASDSQSSDGQSSDSGGSDSGNSDSGNSDSGNSSDNSSDNSRSDSNGTSRDSSDDSTESSDSSESSEKNPIASATVIGLTAAGLGAVFWQAIERSMRTVPPPAPQEVARAAQTYLRSRTHQLREDLALGAGPTVEDLAALARIRREHVGLFGRLLRAHRHELLALADERTLTPERAAAWLRRVGEIARTDFRLEEDGRAFLATYKGEAQP